MSVAPQIIKLNSLTAGPFNESQNIVEFEIPSGMVVSLKDSYLAFNAHITTTEAAGPAADSGDSVYPVTLKWRDAPSTGAAMRDKVPNVSLIRDASISCERRGQIENIRQLDQLKSNLGAYTESVVAQDSNSWVDMCKFDEPFNQSYNNETIFTDLVKIGDSPSRNLAIAPVQIALEDIFDFCKTDEFDTGRAGRTTIRTRLNIDRLIPVAIGGQAGGAITGWGAGINLMVGIAATTASSTLTTIAKVKSLDQSPYYVGMKIAINATSSDGGGFAEVSRNIQSINWDETVAGQIQLTLDAEWVAVGNPGTLTDVTVTTPVDTASAPAVAISWDYAEIILKEVSNPQGYDEISYNTFGTEQTNGNGLTSYRNIFNIEPEATSVLITFPAADSNLYSTKGTHTSYNLRLNNEDLTDNREITFGEPLDKDRVNMGLTNMGLTPRNLLQNAGDLNNAINYRYNRDEEDLCIIAAPLRVTAQQKLLQVSVEDTAGVNAISMFKELPRVFSY